MGGTEQSSASQELSNTSVPWEDLSFTLEQQGQLFVQWLHHGRKDEATDSALQGLAVLSCLVGVTVATCLNGGEEVPV